jgi:flagellar hook-basal body complex protein FliE
MSIDAIAAIGSAPMAVRPTAVGTAPATDFASLVSNGLEKVDQGLKAADGNLRALAAGQDVAVHDVMISMESARMNLMLMVEVRNRLVEAYQELMRMQL